MRSKRVLALIVSSALTLVMASGIGRASAEPVDPATNPAAAAPLATCDAPPNNADATPQNRDAFITEWMGHIADKPWFAKFANLGALPADVAGEPYFAMGKDTQAWLISCLVDTMLATAGHSADDAEVQRLQIGLNLVIFGKAELSKMRTDLNKKTPASVEAPPVPTSLTPDGMKAAEDALGHQPSLTTASLPKSNATTPITTSSSNLFGNASARLQKLAGESVPRPTLSKAGVNSTSTPNAVPVSPNSVVDKLVPLFSTPIVAFLLKAVQNVLQLIANIQQKLFTIPGLNLLAAAFYRVCAESATQPLACSVSLPVGVPSLVDVTGDNFPDMTADVLPLINPTSVGVKIYFAKLLTSKPLPAHIFIVYDTPIVKKRIEFGFDGRASSLANQSTTTVWVRNLLKAATGDVQVDADISSHQPGSSEAMTFAIKDLIGGSTGTPPSEANPTAGAVQFTPFPTEITASAHMVHTTARDQDTFNITSSVPSTVQALVDQDTTTTTPKSHREITALIDQMPTSVNVDLLHQGQLQTITYTASAPIAHVNATDTAVPDTSHPGSFTRSIYDVWGVPSSVQVQLQGAQDIKYAASSTIPQASFLTQTFIDSVLQQQIAAQVNQVPANIHVSNITGADQTKVTYDADSVLGSVLLSMYDLSPNSPKDKSNLVATAVGIPRHIEFTQTKAAGALDFLANAGIQQINVDFARADGTVLPLAGDHVTVHKVGDALGLQLQLSGFKSAHFDGSQKTNVSLGLDPGGQPFNALADLDSPNILAKAHVSELPSSMSVSIDPATGLVTYAADRIIPELDGSFLQRDTQTLGDFTLLGLPKNINLTFNTGGLSPEILYEADSRLTSIEGTYQKAPNDLSFHAIISDLPQFMRIHGQDPTVFDARTASTDPIGTSYLGQVRFDYATDGVFQHALTPDDHVLLNTTGGQTHAELVYTGLKYLSVDTSNQELHAEVRNAADRLVRAFVTTDNLSVTAFIDKVPAKVQIDQVGDVIQYHASSEIAEIFTALHRANGDSIQADVLGVPNFINVLMDSAASKIDWTASDSTDSISVLAHLTPATTGAGRTFDAELTITDIPNHWFVTYPNGNVDFEAGGSGIGAIDARVTNHTSYHTLAGDHLHAYFDQPTGDLDASLHISNLTKAAFSKVTDANGGGFTADLNMGNHGLFNFGAEITLNTNKLIASGNFTHLPSTIHLSSIGGRIQYNGNDNPDLRVSVQAGDNTALAGMTEPAFVHGVILRDGASAGGKAVWAKLYLTGLPDHLDLNSPAGTYTVDNFHPTQDPLVVDVVLTTLASQPLSLRIDQNIGLASPVDFTFGPFLSSTTGDTHSMSLNYTASRDLGSLTAEATYGNSDDAKLFISEIPGGTAPSIAVNAAFGSSQKTINIAMSHDIGQITASYKHAGDPDFTLGASVDLTSVPKTVNMVIGRATDSSGGKSVSAPDFEYTADHAGLNITAYANAALFGGDITAEAHLLVTNIGQHVTGALDGTSIHITSSPATGSFLLTAAGTVNIDVDLGFSAGPFVNTGNLHVNANIKQLTLGFKGASDLRIDLGITTGLTGDFTEFSLGEQSTTIVTVDDHFHFVLDLDVFGTVDVGIVDINNETFNLGDIVGKWHLNSNTDGFLSLLHLSAGLAHCDIGINYRPKAEGSQDNELLVLPAPPNDGHSPAAWLITPDPVIFGFSLPDFALDVIAFFASPYGHGISPGVDCDFGP